MRLSLCMIVRDEEPFLDACLRSVVDHVDEIVVVDTGSSDRTVEIAQSHGARVFHVTWRDHFAAARNASLDMATGDWALVLDADERLVDGAAARAAIDAFVADHEGWTGRIEIVERPDATRSRVTRLVPLDGLHEFVGRVHEEVGFALGAPLRGDLDVEVVHLGRDESVIAKRGQDRRHRALLERELVDRPDDPRAWYQLGRAHFEASDHEAARGALERALDLAPDGAPHLPHLVETLAHSLRALGRPTEALRLVDPVLLQVPGRADTQFVASLLALDLGHLERARRGFLRCLDLADAPPVGAPHDPQCTGASPAYQLGVMAEALGRSEEARGWYERALGSDSGHGPSLAGLARTRSAA